MARLTPAYPFRPAGSRAISLIHVSQISGDHRQDEGRKRLPGATNAGHMQNGPVMQAELFQFPISAAAQMLLNRIALRGAFDSMVDVMTDLRKLPDDGYAHIKQLGRDLVGELDRAETAFRGRVA